MAHTLDHVPHLEMGAQDAAAAVLSLLSPTNPRTLASGLSHVPLHSLSLPPTRPENLVRGVANSTSWFFFQLCFLLSMILMAVSCIIVTALSFDSLLILLCGQTWGLQVTPRPRFVEACPAGPWQCEGQIAFQAVSLERGGTVISLGYALTVALTAPLAMVDVSEPFQLASYVVSMVCVLWLIVKFALIAWQDGVEHPPHSSHMPPLWRNNMGLALEVRERKPRPVTPFAPAHLFRDGGGARG